MAPLQGGPASAGSGIVGLGGPIRTQSFPRKRESTSLHTLLKSAVFKALARRATVTFPGDRYHILFLHQLLYTKQLNQNPANKQKEGACYKFRKAHKTDVKVCPLESHLQRLASVQAERKRWCRAEPVRRAGNRQEPRGNFVRAGLALPLSE